MVYKKRGFGKRGVSPIVVTVLIILLTVVAAMVVAGIVIPFVRDNLKKGGECLDYQDYFKFEEEIEFEGEIYHYNCYDGDRYGTSVRAGGLKNASSDEVGGVNLVFSGGDISGLVSSSSLDVFGGEEFDIPQRGEIITYVYSFPEPEEYTKMEIYPVLKSGRVCEKSDEINVVGCAEEVDLS